VLLANPYKPNNIFTAGDLIAGRSLVHANQSIEIKEKAEICLNIGNFIIVDAHRQLTPNASVMIQGASDTCDLPAGPEGQEKYFLNGYERIVLAGVGHFPHREAPDKVADAALRRLPAIRL
jgi:pimeloyl-ACP methyl ester carboxylesterase